ncbi:hypothetical protein [Nocardiopsis ansamitocini]|uniref:Uncharacterized protein n=1 Tax=Nocardiopsis ansamitocini TaxID=1670832 RepID=A0A9W6P6Z5_9ACTN|nr:hypothetical protein [Nocardiopsis ansamitocini]GLU48625.1 hypothetical protein Nans01_29760 [Nocardiopsis ansamitocini]
MPTTRLSTAQGWLRRLYHEHGEPLLLAARSDPRLHDLIVVRAGALQADLCARGIRPRTRRARQAITDQARSAVEAVTAPNARLPPPVADGHSWFCLELAACYVLLTHNEVRRE